MSVCVFNVETTGLPSFFGVARNEYPSYTATQKYTRCRLVKISWIVLDGACIITDRQSFIVKPVGFVIPLSSVFFHGIMMDTALNGIDLNVVMAKMYDAITTCTILVSHNLAFCKNVLMSELSRMDLWSISTLASNFDTRQMMDKLLSMNDYCTMKHGAFQLGFSKSPKLCELFTALFYEPFPNIDKTQHCVEIYTQLRNNESDLIVCSVSNC